MDDFQLAWLRAQLGPDTDAADLELRFARLGYVRAVALEVLAERRAKLLADPLRVAVDGVVTVDNSNNLTGIERQIKAMAELPAPDDLLQEGFGDVLSTTWLRPARRFR